MFIRPRQSRSRSRPVNRRPISVTHVRAPDPIDITPYQSRLPPQSFRSAQRSCRSAPQIRSTALPIDRDWNPVTQISAPDPIDTTVYQWCTIAVVQIRAPEMIDITPYQSIARLPSSAARRVHPRDGPHLQRDAYPKSLHNLTYVSYRASFSSPRSTRSFTSQLGSWTWVQSVKRQSSAGSSNSGK